MNNLLTYSHHLNNVVNSISALSKTVTDQDKKIKALEKQNSELQSLLNRLQERLIDIDAASRASTSTSTIPPPQISEDRIKSLIKDQIDVTIKSMLTVQAVEQVPPVPTPQTPLPDLMENVDGLNIL